MRCVNSGRFLTLARSLCVRGQHLEICARSPSVHRKIWLSFFLLDKRWPPILPSLCSGRGDQHVIKVFRATLGCRHRTLPGGVGFGPGRLAEVNSAAKKSDGWLSLVFSMYVCLFIKNPKDIELCFQGWTSHFPMLCLFVTKPGVQRQHRRPWYLDLDVQG